MKDAMKEKFKKEELAKLTKTGGGFMEKLAKGFDTGGQNDMSKKILDGFSMGGQQNKDDKISNMMSTDGLVSDDKINKMLGKKEEPVEKKSKKIEKKENKIDSFEDKIKKMLE